MESGLIASLQAEIRRYSAFETLAWALARFGRDRIVFATSFGAEDQVITDILAHLDPSAHIFTLDTGMLPRETLETLQRTQHRYGFAIQIVRPEPAALEEMLQEHGRELYYESVEKRKLCCHVRKVEPLHKTLAGWKAWICGLRREQSVTRRTVARIEWDEVFRLYKINPLVDWTESQVWEYIRNNDVPYNALHDQGYRSIGCAPCTRAVQPGEDVRSGRWWWENPEHKECGLHVQDGKIVGPRSA
jgi:phosphoadenosine phosphosulfate reductase